MTTTEKFQQKLSDSKSARWTALLIVAITMMFGYFFTDVMSPLEPLLTAAKEDGGLGLGWTSDEYGFFSGSYGFFNVFLLLLFFGGIILDKFGIRFTGVIATLLMFAGALVNGMRLAISLRVLSLCLSLVNIRPKWYLLLLVLLFSV